MRGIKLNPNIRLKVMADDQLEAVHEASLRILERTGVRFDSEDARKRLLRSGGVSHPTRKWVVTFPRAMVEDSITKVTHHNVYCARDRKMDIAYDGQHMFPYTGNGDPKMIDLDTGSVRPSTYEDVEMAARLGDALDNNHFASSLVMANDVPPGLVILKTFEAMVKNSTKSMSAYAPDKANLDFLLRMAACVAGSAEELRKRPIISISGSPSSPLTYAENNCDVLLRCVESGIPFQPVPCPICGETGPMSIGGALAQQNAEIFGGLMLVQTVTTKLPMLYSGRVCFMDPRTGRDLWGIPEEALASAALVQLARRYKMVSDTNGMSADITRWDMQMGLEFMMTGLVPALAGAESISGVGGGWEGASSLEMMVIGNEIFNDVSRLLQGFQVDDQTMGLGIIDKVGHMGEFLGERHTMDNLRKGELRISSLWDKRTSGRASKEGFKPIQETARDHVRKILEEHAPDPLDRDVVMGIDAVVNEAAKALLR
jgi:trimethylamine--corrinoid protein Co-methyltransferase